MREIETLTGNVEHYQNEFNEANHHIVELESELAALRSITLSPEEAAMLIALIERTPMTYPAELTILYKKLRARASQGEQSE